MSFEILVIVFGAGIATVYILYKLTISGFLKQRHRTRLVFLRSTVVILVAVAVWPVFGAFFLFKEGEYLLGVIPLLYALPYCVGLGIVIRPVIRLARFARTNGIDAAKARTQSWRERLQRDAPTSEQYAEETGLVWKLTSNVLMQLYTIFITPLLFLLVTLGTKLGARVAWLPDFEPAWFVLFASLSYVVAATHHPAVALAMSSYLLLLKLFDVIGKFETRKGILKMLSYNKYQVRLSDIVFAAFVMASSFGCIHYCISLLNPAAYSRPLTAIDGLYFSVITFATVGYGDIYPASSVSKLACMAEIVSGCLVLLFGVNLVMMVWFQKVTDSGTGAGAANTDTDPTAAGSKTHDA